MSEACHVLFWVRTGDLQNVGAARALSFDLYDALSDATQLQRANAPPNEQDHFCALVGDMRATNSVAFVHSN